MPDPHAPVNVIQNSLSAGELSSSLYGRTDLEKYGQGAAIMRNWFVEYKGGCSTRPGTQYIGQPGSAGYARLIPFIFSYEIGQTYLLIFSDLKLRIAKNPGTKSYPNGSNAALIESGGSPYELVTPYTADELLHLSYVQVNDIMWLAHRNHPRIQLRRNADDDWELVEITPPTTLAAPTMTSVLVSGLPSGSTDPQTTHYIYAVSAVDENGVESPVAYPAFAVGINIGSTQGSVEINWEAVAGAKYYRVYKGLPSSGDFVPPFSTQLGFIGFSYGTQFLDTNIVPDFVQSPLLAHDPFAVGAISGYTINNPGTGYPVSTTTISVSDPNGSGAIIYPILDTTESGATGGIVGLYIVNPGSGYTAPTVSATGGSGVDFDATLEIGPTTGLNPGTVAILQQRILYASTANKPSTIFGSRPAELDDFRASNPVVDHDSFEFDLTAPYISYVSWMQSMPGGLVLGTPGSILQLTGGGGGALNPTAITPTNALVVPQSSHGAARVPPIIVDYDILYVQSDDCTVRNLAYNFLANTYASADLTVLSSHLFYPSTITEWAYQDVPYKVIWARRNDGRLLSLTYLKLQEVQGWAWHETDGEFESVAAVREGVEDAIYVSVRRGSTTRYIERFAGRVYEQAADAWCLDAALSSAASYPNATLTPSAASGTNVVFISDVAVFASGDVGKVITAGSARATVTAFDSTTQVRVAIDLPFEAGVPIDPNGWRLDPVVTSVTGLDHLEGREVYALVDGEVQGPFTVTLGSITLTTGGASVVVGLPYTCSLQPLYIDVSGEATIQGKRKKVVAASIRVKDAAGLKYGTSFETVREWTEGVSSTDTNLITSKPGLYTGDQRTVLNQYFNVGGWVAIQQDYPLPATVLAVISELAQGDTM